jgi:uncharacterized protein YcfJ
VPDWLEPKKEIDMTAPRWLLALMLVPSMAFGAVHYADAPVLGVEPMYETVQVNTPREVCREERYAVQPRQPGRSVAAPLLGAAVGGALGHTIGDDRNENNLGAAVGAIMGGAFGLAYANRPQPVYAGPTYQIRQVCALENDIRTEDRLVGYRVRYRYDGEVYVTETNAHPGDYVRVRVEVTPVS